MKRIGLVLCVGAACLAFAVTAGARGGSHPSNLVVDGSGDVPTEGGVLDLFIAGHVKSPSSKCVANRTVKMYFGYENENALRLVDIAKSGRSGQFAARGSQEHGTNAINAVTLKLLKKKLGPKHHHQTCKGKSLPLT
jgi:hypothetical protein